MGSNKPGGIGGITKISSCSSSSGDKVILYDIKYSLGGREKNVHKKYVLLMKNEEEENHDNEKKYNQDTHNENNKSKKQRSRRAIATVANNNNKEGIMDVKEDSSTIKVDDSNVLILESVLHLLKKEI